MKNLSLSCIFTVLFSAVFFVNCSNSNDEIGSDSILSKKLESVRTNNGWSVKLVYDSKNNIVGLSDNNHSVSLNYKDNVLSSNAFKATIENGKVSTFEMDDKGKEFTCKMIYNNNGKIASISNTYGSTQNDYSLIWDGNNISKIEYRRNGELYGWVKYTYTHYKAGYISFLCYFNPFGEFNFLDGIEESAIFYTGLCGNLSFNLPETAESWGKYKPKSFDENNETRIRNYSYKVNDDNYPTEIYIIGSDFIDDKIDENLIVSWK